jgi:hypothetical protein
MDAPHGGDDSFEPTEQHGGGQMHDLIRLSFVPFSCLTCTEKGQEGVVHPHLHELQNSQTTVVKTETAVRRVSGILDPMTRQVHNVCSHHSIACSRHEGLISCLFKYLDFSRASHCSDFCDLRIHSVYHLESLVIPLLFGYEDKACRGSC